jgi:ABC-type branched-subunit amino acid transport system substrate-binding protein
MRCGRTCDEAPTAVGLALVALCLGGASRVVGQTSLTIGGLYDQANDDVSANAYIAAARLAVAEVNANATVLSGASLVLTVVDHGSIRALSRSHEGYETLLGNMASDLVADLEAAGAVGVVGAGYSSDVKALAQPLLRDAQLPLISHSATAPSLSDSTTYPGFARLCAPDRRQGAAMAAAVAQFGWDRIGLVHCPGVYCEELAGAFVQALRDEHGGRRVDFQWRTDFELTLKDVTHLVDFIEAELQAGCDDEADQAMTAVTILIVDTPEDVLAAGGHLKTSWLGHTPIGDKIFHFGNATASTDILALRPATGLPNARTRSLQSVLPEYGTSPYVINAYDAVWSMALAINAVRDAEGDAALADGTKISSALQDVVFLGAAGLVAFDENLDPPTHSSAAGYDIVHSPADSLAVSTIGRWELGARGISGVTSESLAAVRSFPPVDCSAAESGPSGWKATAIILVAVVSALILLMFVAAKYQQRDSVEPGLDAEQERAVRAAQKLLAAGGKSAAELEKKTRPESMTAYTTFLSHHKNGAGETAANLRTLFDRSLARELRRSETGNYLDVENLAVIDMYNLVRAVRSTEVLVLLLSKDVMQRPWCLVEIHTALSYGVPIVPIELESGADRWPRTPEGEGRRVEWPTDAELRRKCHKQGLDEWLDALPTEKVDEYHEALRSKLSSYSRRKYNAQEAETIRSAVEGYVVELVAAAAHAGREPPVEFNEVAIQSQSRETDALSTRDAGGGSQMPPAHTPGSTPLRRHATMP